MAFPPSRLAALILLGAAPLCGLRADSPAVSLGAPKVMKLDWGTRGLTTVDLDGDGSLDLALLNNDRSRIDLLYQRGAGAGSKPANRSILTTRWEPPVDDAPFEKGAVTTGVALFDLAAADLNGDGRVDLAYTGEPDALTVRYQEPGGKWGTRRVFDVGTPSQMVVTLRAADLNGDKRADLAALLQNELVVYLQDEKGELRGPDRYALPEAGCYGLETADVNADGKTDLLFLAPGSRDALRLRLQREAGKFGPERALRLDAGQSTLQFLSDGGRPTGAFAYVQTPSNLVALASIQIEKREKGALPSLRPKLYSTRAGGKTPAAYALGDFDGDGRLDLAATDPEGNQIHVYLQQRDGDLAPPAAFPSLTDLRGLAAGDQEGDGRAELFVLSGREQSLGVASYEEGRLTYPQPVPIKGKPIALAVGDVEPDGRAELVLVREEGGKRFLEVVHRNADGSSRRTTTELVGLKTDPRAVRLLDANQDDRIDAAIFTPFEPLRVVLQGADGTWSEVPGFRKGFVDNLDPAALSTADVDGDGKEEMLVAAGALARALRIDPQGALVVVEQFNARETTSDISNALRVSLPGVEGPAMLLLDRKTEHVQILRRNDRGVFAPTESVPAGKIDLVGSAQLDFNGDRSPDLFYFGKDRFWWLPLGEPAFAAPVSATYETDLKDVTHVDLAAGDLNGDGRTDLVALDPDRHVVEILTEETEGWKSRLHFKVFENDPHFQGRQGPPREPREVIVADLTGDGKKDLVVLVHDRLLVYPQE